MDVREILFNSFPRNVGNPKQISIHNRNELNRFAAINSSDNDKNFVSSCSYQDNIPVFEDLFLEVDVINPEPIRRVIIWFESHKIPYIILLSASRGFHIHGLFQPEIVKQKTVKKFAESILDETQTKEFFDPHVTGDIKRLCRIPNTQRLGNGWCVPITREELFNINDSLEFKKLCSSPRFLDFEAVERPSIFNFIKDDETEDKSIQDIQIAPPKEIFFLKHILRPCVYKNVLIPNPKHDFRVSSVVEMFNHGLTNSQIFAIFERLQWIDFDHSKTHYQIDYIEQQRINGKFTIPYGKKRLGCNNKNSCIECIFNWSGINDR